MIRKATAADIDAIEASYNELFEHERRNGSLTQWIQGLYHARATAEGGGERGGREGQPRGMQPSRRRRNGNGGNGGNSAEQRGGQQAGQGGAEGAAKPRRRRHRGGRGRGGAAGGGSGAAPAGGSE